MKLKFQLIKNFFRLEGKGICPICTHTRVKFKPLPRYYIEMYKKFGYEYYNDCEMTVLKTYSCPYCEGSDRERLVAFFLNKFLTDKPNQRIAHFAPEQPLSVFLKKHTNVELVTIDLHMDGVDIKGDITNLSAITNESFDGFICSHVLEHIEDDKKALEELYRILKPGSWGILMVPISTKIQNTIENKDYKTIEQRWKYYGQDDHVRLYSKNGFKNKVKEVCFSVKEYGVEIFGKQTFRELGLKKTSVLYFLEKL